MPVMTAAPVYSPAIGSMSLPWTLVCEVGFAQDGVEVLLDEIGLAFLDHQHGALARAEPPDLVVDQRIGDVQNVERNLAVAERVGQAEQFERRGRWCCTCRPAG